MGKAFDHAQAAMMTVEPPGMFIDESDSPRLVTSRRAIFVRQFNEAQRNTQALEAYRNRPMPKFSELPFVGKKYRSRNRRSADKMTAWAVKPELGAMAAVQGFEYARQLIQSIGTRNSEGKMPWVAYGVHLENIIIGMADTLANCKPDDKNANLTVIRGFCSLMEMAAVDFLDGNTTDEKLNAATYARHMARIDEHKPHVYDCNTQPWACRLEKHRMLR